jgi:polysaccharide export outer membrane protein
MKTLFKYAILLFFIFGLQILATFAQNNREIGQEYYEQGNIYYQQGRYKEAQEEFQKALDLLNNVEEPAVTEVKEEKEPPSITEEQKEAKSQLEYVIGEEDILIIAVWQNPDLTQDAIVRPDGKISFPLIGDVLATGRTVSELDQEITGRLKEYIRQPEVSISIKKLGGNKVMVLGEVTSPGVYAVTGSKTILEAITLAGGFTKNSVPSSVVLIRGGFENPQAQRINLSKALSGKPRLNVALLREDIIFVPKKFIANVNYFLEQLIGPLSKGAYATRDTYTW